MHPISPFKRVDPGPQNGPPIKEGGPNGFRGFGPVKPLQGPRKGNGKPTPILSDNASANLRDQLLAELEGIGIKDDPDAWALRAWPKVNTLRPEDGDRVRVAFQAQLTRLREVPNEDVKAAEPAQTPDAEPRARIDKSVLALPEPRRLRDKQHLRFVAKQPCLICGREPCDPHHLRFAQSRGLAQKVSDEFTVPLCRAHHRELHRAGKEREWWSRIGIEPLDVSRELWLGTRADPRPHGGSLASSGVLPTA